MKPLFALSVAFGLGALAACSSSSSPPLAGSGTDAGAPDATGLQDDAGANIDAGVTPPDSPAGQALTFVLSALNGAKITTTDVNAHFTPAFVSSVGASAIIGLFSQLAPKKTWTLTGFVGTPTPNALAAIVTRMDGQVWRIDIDVPAATPMQMDGLLLSPAGDLDPALSSWGAIDAKLATLASNVSEMGATIDATGCTPTHEVATDQSRALGSQFKLWILATLAQQIDSGMHAWTDPITIVDKEKSLPSGTYQNQPNGMMLPAQSFAENMISISDNTAADHLLFFVGRDQVEAMLATAKHHDPSQNTPFLSTRELFDLKLLLNEQDRQTYIADSVADKRTALQTYDDTLDPRTFAGSFTTPVDIDKLEWFATPKDLCNVFVTLKSYADKPGTAEVYHVLSINPGLADDAGLFSYIGYKGGSEPGVLTMSWLLRRKSDSAYRFYTLEMNDTQKALDEDSITYVAGAARALMAK